MLTGDNRNHSSVLGQRSSNRVLAERAGETASQLTLLNPQSEFSAIHQTENVFCLKDRKFLTKRQKILLEILRQKKAV